MSRLDELIAELCPDGVEYRLLAELEDAKLIKLGRGNVVSKKEIREIPGNYPVYSSSAVGNGEIGSYGKYMFNDERITWSIDGGGRFFYRPAHRYSITNVSGFIKILSKERINTKYLFYALINEWRKKIFNYTHKAHPSIIRNEYKIPIPPLPIQQEIVRILDTFPAVSYTHLTLPTIHSVLISVVAVSLKKKKHRINHLIDNHNYQYYI